MSHTSKIVMPYEPDYALHREAEKRRNATRQWLMQRERSLGFDPMPSPHSPANLGR